MLYYSVPNCGFLVNSFMFGVVAASLNLLKEAIWIPFFDSLRSGSQNHIRCDITCVFLYLFGNCYLVYLHAG